MASAAGGLFDLANHDWFKHRLIFANLGELDWPVYPPDDNLLRAQHDGTGRPMEWRAPEPVPFLRYYLGYYMVPGLATKVAGLEALRWAIPLWTWAGVALLMVLFTANIASSTCKAVAAALILVFFSGMDVVRLLLIEGWEGVRLQFAWGSGVFEFNKHIVLQYSANTACLFFVPQHFIAAGLGTMLLLRARDDERLPLVVGVLFAAIAFWSPFVALGLLPLAAALLIERGPMPFLGWRNLLVAPLVGTMLAVYFLADSANVLRGWMWNYYPGEQLVPWLALFAGTEFVVLVVVLLALRPRYAREGFFLASVATLLLLPLYVLGSANDWGMRASLPALLMLCWYTARALLEPAPARARRSDSADAEGSPPPYARFDLWGWAKLLAAVLVRRLWHSDFARKLPVALVFALGTVTPLEEFARSIKWSGDAAAQAAMEKKEEEDRIILTKRFQYIAHDGPAPLRALLKPPPSNSSATTRQAPSPAKPSSSAAPPSET